MPPRTELQPQDVTHVFGYPRDLTARYYLGRVLGAGSFGVVRECIGVSSGLRHAVKTIPKAPKRGPSTPR
jgi:calcium-dependent protein kinase